MLSFTLIDLGNYVTRVADVRMIEPVDCEMQVIDSDCWRSAVSDALRVLGLEGDGSGWLGCLSAESGIIRCLARFPRSYADGRSGSSSQCVTPLS